MTARSGVENDGTDPVAGQFAGLGQGASFTLGGPTAFAQAGGVPLGGLQLVPQPFGLGLGLPQQLPRLGEALLGVLRA